jgi:hypothetical protein
MQSRLLLRQRVNIHKILEGMTGKGDFYEEENKGNDGVWYTTGSN